jgi:LysM repeat protein
VADPSVQKLRDAFANAPAGTVVLNDAFWSGAGLTPPSGFTDSIKAAYRLPAQATGLEITYDRAAVTPVTDDRFQVSGVTLTFLTATPEDTTATIYGTTGTLSTPILGIDVVPAGWQLSKLFSAMDGWPFTLLQLDQQRFFFTTAPRAFAYEGATLNLVPGQNLYGMLTVPSQVQPLFQLVTNLTGVPSSLAIYGTITLDKADNEKILYPDMDLQAPIAAGQDLQLFFLDIFNARLGFVISTVAEKADESGELFRNESGEPVTLYFQTPYFYFGVDVKIKGTDGNDVSMTLAMAVNESVTNYRFSVAASERAHPITPGSIIALMAGNSYFAFVPPVLQEYLASVQMQGFTLAGPLQPTAGVSRLTAMLGSVQDHPIPLFTDPTTGEAFEIKSFSLVWSLSNPLAKPAGPRSARFTATFTLFPDVFRKKDGAPGGLFEIEIDQALDFEGSFTGKASFNDVLSGITGGAIGLPSGVAVDFSDIYLRVQPSQKSYSLGFEVDANVDVPFITGPAGKPLIQVVGMQFKLGASTPSTTPEQKGRTVYTGSIDGQVIVGPAAAHVRVDYDSTLATPLWQLEASLTQPLKVSELVDQFFREYNLPPFLPGDLTVAAFDVKAKIPSTTNKKRAERLLTTRPARHVGGSHHPHGWRSPVRPVSEIALPRGFANGPPAAPQKSSYQVSGKITWDFQVSPSLHIDTTADIGLDYDANRAKGEEFAGSVIGTIDIEQIGAVEIGYRFGPAAADAPHLRLPTHEELRALVAAAGDSQVLWMSWKGFRAEYDINDETVTFSMSGWTVGSLITALVEMLGDDPYFSLPSPWNILNQISLDGLSIAFNLKQGVKNRVTASYSLPSPLDLGILKINGLSFKQVDGKTTLAIDGSTNIPGVKDSPLFKPAGDGQDVKDMPKVPGRGNQYFHLYLLALGQRVAIYQPDAFKTTKDVIDALATIPPSDGSGTPFDPTKQTKGKPYYNRASDWLVAMHFGVFKLPDPSNDYSIDLMVVFNDPDLYGLRLALKGDKVKVLNGLEIDVLYKKITDDIGCYQIEFTLPAVLRNLDIGAFSVTLPVIGLQIYTNGDFLIDFGFPYNLDFSRSFTAQGIIMGVPVLGSGGFYFGKLSNATAPNLPQTTKGTFHPVIVFGFGAQLGVGKYIDKGILKAGFSITVFGIIEGTIAAWHPYDPNNTGPSHELQGDYYFKISGTFGIIGKLYGTVDFVIIKADVSLLVQIVARIVYESFRKIPLSLTASVSVSVSISIDLGLFSISISFSFDTSLSVELTIGSDSTAPWDPDGIVHHARTLHALGIADAPLRLDFTRAARAVRGATQAIELTALPQFTVLAREGVSYAGQEGAFVLLLAMDSPDTKGNGDGADTSFGKLCAPLLPWILASVQPETVSDLLPTVPAGSISRPLLEGILKALADPNNVPFTPTQLVDFVKANFTVAVSAGDGTLPQKRRDALNAGSTIFPAFAFLSLTVPNPDASGNVTVAFDNYVTSTAAYQGKMREIFNSVAANVAAEQAGEPKSRAASDSTPEPMAASIFADYFILLSRQLVQSAIDAFDDYAYPLDANTSIDSIVKWANGLMKDQLTAQVLVTANLTYPLAGSQTLAIAGIPYMVQSGDTLASIATRYTDPGAAPKRWTTDPAALILVNRAQNNLISAGVEITITVASQERKYTTKIGDDFNKIAAGLNVSIQDLSQQSALYTLAGLLAPAVVLTVGTPQVDPTAPPVLTYKTTAGDTVQGVLDLFYVPLALFLTPANLALGGLFQVDPTLRFAVPGLIVLPQDRLWPAILRTGTLRQIAAMAARYMLHGMRLPVAPGLTLPAQGFLYGAPHWPAVQTGYGVYQLTGQQFPLAESNPEQSIALARPSTGFDWLTLGTGASVSIRIGPPASNVFGPQQLLAYVLGWARSNGYKPKVPLLAPEPGTNLAPRRYGMASYAPWQTSDIANLLAVTKPPIDKLKAQAEAAANPQPNPILWALSSGLLRSLERRQATLAAQIPKVKDLARYMPVLTPSVGTTDPATGITSFTPVKDFAFAVRVDFRIKHLAQDVDLAPPRPDANSIVPPGPGNPGAPARPLAPFAYEIIGPNPADAVLLERLLTAMASEGEGIVQDIFLLYADMNNGAQGLTSRAAGEFLSFIVQSNLSTETSPPPALRAAATAAPEPPRGIANKPAEFIKLLWELSTVNSGGTYLFYQLPAEGTGLPTALFDDSGIATLTLVAAMRRDALQPTGRRMLNAINALITTDPIDPQHAIVDLAGVSDPADSLPLAANATLADIAAFYSVDPGTLARSNPGAPLKSGAQIPIAGLYRQLQPADVGPGLAALAAYYSAGAVTPITAADIANFNPGVRVAALAVFRIPPFTYAVGASGPGNTFGSMAVYYAADLSALAYQARAVPGLFVGPKISIDPLSYDAQPNLGLGNAGVTLERERGDPPKTLPQAPTPQQIAAYSSATMLQLYQLLSAGIEANAFFNPSVDSAAFGPKDPKGALPHEAKSARRVRKLAAVRAAPPSSQPYVYDQALGFAGSSTVNPATPPGSSSLPPVSANPYVGIGTILQFRLAWQDLFGNRTPSPFSLPQAGDQPPFGGLPDPILYPDRPIPLDQWPSTTRAYRYSGAAGAPSLDITLKLDTTPYNPSAEKRSVHLNAVRALDTMPVWQRNAVNDLAKYTLIYFQLHQDYTPLKIPGLSGPAVTMSLRNTLMEMPEQPLPDQARDKILSYLDSAIVYLTARSAGNAAPPPADTVISLPIDLGTVAKTRDIIRLELELSFTRASLLVDPALRGLADGLTVSSPIPVDGDLTPEKKAAAVEADEPPAQPKYPVALTQFADMFEKAFVTSNWRMRIGTSSAEPSAPNNARAYTVWAVRMADLSGPTPQGLGLKIGNDPRYYAPLPIASALQTLTVDIKRYATGQPYPDGSPVPTTFTSVDPNAWLAECLAAVDDFLSATYSTPTFVLDRLLGLKESAAGPQDPKLGYLARMLQHKKTLAKSIASTAASVLDQPAQDLRPAAVDKLEQALLRRLSNANTLTCVTVLPVSKATYAPPLPPGVAPPRLFGQPQGVLAAALPTQAGDPNQNFALSTAKVPLVATVPGNPQASDASTLAFLFTSRSAEQQAYVTLKLSYALSHVEHNIHGVPGIDNYEQSSWITFVTGPYVTKIEPAKGDSFAIPVALRALPTPATVVAQTGTTAAPTDAHGSPDASAAATPSELKNWAYEFSYLLNQAAQDSVMAQVEFNRPANGLKGFAVRLEDMLYAKLAQFVAIYPAVARDLETYLRPINGKSEAGSPDVLNAEYAVAALETVVDGVASAYKAWADARAQTVLAAEAPPRVVYRFEIALERGETDPTEAVIHIIPQSFAQDGQPTANFLPLAKVLIDPENYRATLIDTVPTSGEARYRYLLRPDAKDPTLPKVMPYETARLNALRAVDFAPLDLFALQNGWASVQVVRNRHLAPPDSNVKTNPLFEFATAEARFADPLVPLLDYTSYPIDQGATGPQPVDAWVTAFFGSLLAPGTGITFPQPVLVKLETSYSYELVPGMLKVPSTQIPISLLPPTSTEGTTDPAFISAVSAVAQQWFDVQRPVNDATAAFNFGLAVFSAAGQSDMPLLRVGALTLASQNVKQG